MPSEPLGAAPTTTSTDAEGKSTLNKMGGDSVHVYYASGKFTMTASYGDAKVTFHLTASTWHGRRLTQHQNSGKVFQPGGLLIMSVRKEGRVGNVEARERE